MFISIKKVTISFITINSLTHYYDKSKSSFVKHSRISFHCGENPSFMDKLSFV